MSEQTLLPCPFCGTSERDDEQERGLESWLQVTATSGMYRVECFGCGVEARMFDTPEEAIAAWNRRHPSDPFWREESALPAADSGSMYRCPDCAWISLSPRVAAHHREMSGHGEAGGEPLDEDAYLRQGAADRWARASAGVIGHPWQACTARHPAQHIDLRDIVCNAEEAARLYGHHEGGPLDFSEVHLVIGDGCIPCVLGESQITKLLAAGGRPC